jgi:hypothetical protein
MSNNDNAARSGMFGLSTVEVLLMSHSLADVLRFAASQGTLVSYQGDALIVSAGNDESPDSQRATFAPATDDKDTVIPVNRVAKVLSPAAWSRMMHG